MHLVNYFYPDGCPKAEDIKVRINGEEVFVYYTKVSYIACVSFEGSIEVEVEAQTPVSDVQVRPLSRNIAPRIEGCTVYFTVNQPENLSVEIDGFLPLLFSANSLEKDIPRCKDGNIHYFKGGQIYQVGEIWLNDNDTLYIEGGAVVKGCIKANNCNNIRICGRGILDGSIYEKGSTRSIQLKKCTNVSIEGIIMVEPPSWMIDIRGCQDVHIDNVKQVGIVVSSDGVDVVSCKDVLIENCFLHNNDDCVVIKAFGDYEGRLEWDTDVENVLVRHCVMVNDEAGNAVEIGHELRTDLVKNVVFRDCDILSVHGCGAAFSIHNGDHAMVRDILYEDIRVEHYYDRLIDFRIMCSRFNRDKERGQVRNVHLKDIKVICRPYNPGYSVSLIGGYDAGHTIEGVTIENFYLNDKKATNGDELDLHTKHTKGIVFK